VFVARALGTRCSRSVTSKRPYSHLSASLRDSAPRSRTEYSGRSTKRPDPFTSSSPPSSRFAVFLVDGFVTGLFLAVARANFRTVRSPHPPLDRYRLNHYAAIRLQALDQRGPIAVVAMDDRIGFPLADGDQPGGCHSLPDEIALDGVGPTLREAPLQPGADATPALGSKAVQCAADVHIGSGRLPKRCRVRCNFFAHIRA